MREIRLLPLVIVAVTALLALKGAGFLLGESSLLGGNGPAAAQDTATNPQASADAANPDVAADPAGTSGPVAGADQATTGADAVQPQQADAQGAQPPEQNTDKDPAAAKADEPSFLQRVLGGESRSRDAILDSLSERRQQLDAREKEMDLRENLLKAAEQRVEQRISELKDLEAKLAAVDQEQEQSDADRMKNLVTMYENMKPKDAARIFDRLDMSVVVQVASKMSARQMSLVLAEMQSETAQRLTLELAAKPARPVMSANSGGDLPKIVGTRPAN